MKYVPKIITQKIGFAVLRTQKHSPTILFVVGVGGAITATVLACRATLRIESVLTDHEQKMLELSREEGKISNVGRNFDRDRQKLLLGSALSITKLYGPSLVVGVVSIGCLTKSHAILSERNTQLTAAYVGLQQFLEGYRGRVRKEIGETREQDVYYAATPVELVEDGPNGPIKVMGSTPGKPSPYSAVFDDSNGNWQDSNEYNINFLRIQEQLLTDKLRAQGSLMLNEVYDRLDIPRTPTGARCGWMIDHPDSDDFVEIRIFPMHDFHGTLFIDFNVAGDVHHMLSGRASGRRSRS